MCKTPSASTWPMLIGGMLGGRYWARNFIWIISVNASGRLRDRYCYRLLYLRDGEAET